MKFLLGIALALGISAAAYAAAATLNVNGGTIQAGEDNLVTCTESANVLGWGFEGDDGTVRSVRVEVDANCVGNTIFLTVTGTGPTTPFTVDQDIADEGCGAATAGYICVSLGGADGFHAVTTPAEITDVHIVIEGSGGTPDDAAP